MIPALLNGRLRSWLISVNAHGVRKECLQLAKSAPFLTHAVYSNATWMLLMLCPSPHTTEVQEGANRGSELCNLDFDSAGG